MLFYLSFAMFMFYLAHAMLTAAAASGVTGL